MSTTEDLTASEAAAIAYAVQPIAPQGLALAIEIVVYIFFVLTTIPVILRVWARSSWMSSETGRVSWGLDDSLAVLGFVSLLLLF